MDKVKVIAYSVLAHINNSNPSRRDLIDVFIPLVKRTLSKMSDKGTRDVKGKSLLEVVANLKNDYYLEFPIPIVRIIFGLIAEESNQFGSKEFVLYRDDSFEIKNYSFLDFEEVLKIKEGEIEHLESLFRDFCGALGQSVDAESLFDFLDQNQLTIGKYLTHDFTNVESIGESYPKEAQFIAYARRFPAAYRIVKDVYLGSLLSRYLEYSASDTTSSIELLLDTNFILSLIDLNTPEGTHTCSQLVQLANKHGMKMTVLDITINECQQLIEKKAEFFDKTFLAKKIDPEDIYNACDRRQLNKTDLERISHNLSEALKAYGIEVLPNTNNLQAEARRSKEFDKLLNVRNTSFSALHDATAIQYVKNRRQRNIRDFDKVNCWFVNNSSNIKTFSHLKNSNEVNFQPTSIKAEELLSILWLSNPNIAKDLKAEDVVDSGITRLISSTLSDTLPKGNVIKKLDENIQKYGREKISDGDIVRVATRIASRNIQNVEELNNLAKNDSQLFVARLQEEAEKQRESERETAEGLGKLVEKFTVEIAKAAEIQAKFESEHDRMTQKESWLKQEKIQSDETSLKVINENAGLRKSLNATEKENERLRNKILNPQIREYYRARVFNWRLRGFAYLFIAFVALIGFIVIVLLLNDWSYEKCMSSKGSWYYFVISIFLLVFNGFFIKRFSDQFNQSAVAAYTNKIKDQRPEHLKGID